ncbi:hypothetical protein JAAARDRAFT_207938 [Jaapia argillacea MUCL 33604]|uniref:F-box domain-containing protein n=1 Tax=Jaapia argillacea MUCL 33604 TaxID=933084 RepID=A0A067PQ23_9AGAM|nr:hypothetical protein JAAARDRAFT_207938 [Jaapia argillacea MUCL 33604]
MTSRNVHEGCSSNVLKSHLPPVSTCVDVSQLRDADSIHQDAGSPPPLDLEPPNSPPIFRLPIEILSHIFLLASEIPHLTYMDHDPLTNLPIILSHVNTHFRRTALTTLALWSVIFPNPLQSAQIQIEKSQTYLMRSQSYPLDVVIKTKFTASKPFLNNILPHSHRFRHLTITCSRCGPECDDITIHRLTNSEAPLLEVFESTALFYKGRSRNPLKLFQGHAPRLHTIRLHTPMLDLSHFTNLRCVELDSRPQGNDLQQMVEMMNLPNLTKVSIAFSPFRNALLPSTDRPRSLASLSLRHLSLTIEPLSGGNTVSAVAFILNSTTIGPSLHTLELDTRYGSVSQYTPSIVIQALGNSQHSLEGIERCCLTTSANLDLNIPGVLHRMSSLKHLILGGDSPTECFKILGSSLPQLNRISILVWGFEIPQDMVEMLRSRKGRVGLAGVDVLEGSFVWEEGMMEIKSLVKVVKGAPRKASRYWFID